MTCSPQRRSLAFRMCLAFAMLLSASLDASAAARRGPADLESGTLSFGGRERSYFYHLPANESGSNRPLLIALHGGGKANGDEYARNTGYNRLADRQGFIVVYPNGINAQWNDGRGQTFRGAPDNTIVDDLGYISALIDYFVSRYGADPSRIYVEGTSNGGMMAQRIGCELSGKVAAIAGVVSAMPANIRPHCSPAFPVPVLMMSATTDPWVPFEGGVVKPLGKPSGEVLGAWETIRFWADHNHCSQRPVTRSLPDRKRRDHSTVRKHSFRSCRDGATVELYEVIGAGHSRPGMPGRIPERILGEKNEDIDASSEIWSFLKQFTR